MKRIKNILHAGDNTVNAMFGGDPDASISARTGFHTASHYDPYWNRLGQIIDWGFAPIEERHCLDAWKNDQFEDYQDAGRWDRIGLAVVVTPFCLMLGTVLRIRKWWLSL